MKKHGRTSTGAKVSITIELSNLGSWGPECPTGQVHDQAIEAAIGRINRAFREDKNGIRLVGPVRVEAVTTDMERTK
jgi:hypothetical protein